MRIILILLLAATAGCVPEYGSPDHGSYDNPAEGYLYGVVVGITDGDTFTLLTPAKEKGKIRLAEIDTPERGQPFGKWAKEQLSALVFQKDVAVLVMDVDRYERIVGRVYVDNLDVNAELVRLGAAWVYDQYAMDASLYTLQDEARNAGRGLWSEPYPIAPWEWRKR